MSKYSELLDGKPEEPKKPESMPAFGSFACQECGEPVEEARYYPTESLLVWDCSKKHKSYIEGFDLM